MDDIILSPSDIDENVVARAEAVQDQLRLVGRNMESGFLEMCDLLMEAHQKSYHTVYGFGRFGDWIETGSGLDISARQGMYYVQIAKKAKQLGLSRDEISKAKISKLKTIFQLDPLEHSEEMKQLVANADHNSLTEIEGAVRGLRKAVGKSTLVTMKIKIEPEAKEVVDEAFELARMNYGSVVRDDEVVDISDGKCLELISAEYLNDPQNHDQREFGAEHREDDFNG